MTPEISVLVPACNDGRFIATCLESLAAQTFPDFEAIVADDGSSDETPAIASAWSARDGRFRLSRLEQNVGMNRNWNRALREARGRLVIKLDADDAMTPRALEALQAEFRQVEGLLFSACRSLDCNEALEIVGPFRGDLGFRLHGLDPEERQVKRGIDWLRLCFGDVQLWTSCAQMYLRADLLALGGWDERWMVSDTDLVLRALSLDRPVAHVPEAGILYRRRDDSSSRRERRSGAARLELNLIVLRTLNAQAPRLAPLGKALRHEWWRVWRRFLADSRDEAVWASLPAARRESLRRLERETRALAPPRHVRLEGELRWRARRLRERVRRSPGAPSGVPRESE